MVFSLAHCIVGEWKREKKRWVAAKKLSRASPSLCYVMACPEVAGGYFGHVLAFSKNSPAQLARRHVWSLPLHRKSPAPRSPPPPPLTPAATPRPREAGHLLVARARPLGYVSPPPPVFTPLTLHRPCHGRRCASAPPLLWLQGSRAHPHHLSR